MEFFKKRSTAWTLFAMTVVICLFVGRANKPKTDGSSVEILPSGVYVQDNANILSDSTEKYITQMNNGLASKLGAEVQVVTIDTTNGKNLFDMAEDYGENLNLSGNSLVFFVAVDDIDAVIVQGLELYNAPKYLFTDDNLSMILQDHFTVSDFESRNLDSDVRDAFADIVELYEAYYAVPITGRDNIQREYARTTVDGFRVMLLAFVIFVIIIMIITAMLLRPRRRVIRPATTIGRTTGRGYYPQRNTYTTPSRNNHTSRGGSFSSSTTRTSSRSGGFGSSSSSRGGSFSSSSRSGGFSSSSRGGGFSGGSSRGGGFSGGSRGGGFRK